MYLAPCVVRMLIHSIFVVVKYDVLTVKSSLLFGRLPSAVIQTWFGSFFCLQQPTTILACMMVLFVAMALLSSWVRNFTVCVPFSFFQPTDILTSSIHVASSQISLSSVTFINFSSWWLFPPSFDVWRSYEISGDNLIRKAVHNLSEYCGGPVLWLLHYMGNHLLDSINIYKNCSGGPMICWKCNARKTPRLECWLSGGAIIIFN